MPRGGKRAGSGRPPGKVTQLTREASAEIAASGLTPMAYLHGIMIDPKAPVEQRNWAAETLMPYCHPRLGSILPDAVINASPILSVNVVSIPRGTHFTQEQCQGLPESSVEEITRFVEEANAAAAAEVSDPLPELKEEIKQEVSNPLPDPEPPPQRKTDDDKVVVITSKRRRDPSGPPSTWYLRGAWDR